jgi:hypothetical protein
LPMFASSGGSGGVVQGSSYGDGVLSRKLLLPAAVALLR